MEGFFDVKSPSLRSAGLFNFYLLQGELTAGGMLLGTRKREMEVIEKRSEIRRGMNVQYESIHCASFYYLMWHVDLLK